jgi:putative DNA primase/helicase
MTLDELKLQKRWVLWRYEDAGKVPYQANGRHAQSDNPQTWSTWLELQPFVAQYSGVGIMLGNPLGGADLDHCVEDGKVRPWAQDIITRLNSYTEISPSGTGIRILVVGRHGHDTGRKRKQRETEEAAEVYDNVRFLTFTGNHVPGTPDELCERGAELAWLWDQVDQDKYPPNPVEGIKVQVSRADFDKLNAGDWSAYASQSDAVPAFVYLLCKRYESDEDVDTAFRESGMFSNKWADEKWDRLGAAEIKRARAFIEQTKPLPVIAHATCAEAFLRDNHDFVCVYDLDGRPIAQWVKTRWDISKDDTLLWRAVSDYLKALHDKYQEPKKGPDPRKRFYDATFISGVVRCSKPYLPPVKAELFDQNPHMLGLPGCRVVDLHTSAVRDMRREDYISQRIDVTPDPNCPTPRFDRFIQEITCGDGALANYLLRLCALCLTALPFQALFFLWGRGRNGKGVLIRMLTAILGDGKFAWPLRPSEITVSKFGDDAMKRTFSSLEGKRLVTVNESVSGNLNTSMLKLMSGGDTLSGARMRQDTRAFKPTHKVLLPTNDRPQLPADPAFRGRVHMIPFLANFTGREDSTLDHTLQHVELPGILYRLITLCPDVIENGLRPPASVLAETDQLFTELDVTKQFRDDCLESDPSAETAAVEMEKAVGEWLCAQSAAGMTVVVSPGRDDTAETILKELRHQPDIKYMRLRRDGESKQGTGQGRGWVYVGVRLRDTESVQMSTS